MSMTQDTEIIPCHDDVDDIPMIQFNFVPINAIENKEKNEVIGMVYGLLYLYNLD